jgi:hypothetical protein
MNIYEIQTNLATGRADDHRTLLVHASNAKTAVEKAIRIARRTGAPNRTYDVTSLKLIGSLDK